MVLPFVEVSTFSIESSGSVKLVLDVVSSGFKVVFLFASVVEVGPV